eukprot:11939403-Alexandrium_andersonii.AAC.1
MFVARRTSTAELVEIRSPFADVLQTSIQDRSHAVLNAHLEHNTSDNEVLFNGRSSQQTYSKRE